MAERRRGLGRGIGALIPDNQRESKDRPFDVFFGGGPSVKDSNDEATLSTKDGKPESVEAPEPQSDIATEKAATRDQSGGQGAVEAKGGSSSADVAEVPASSNSDDVSTVAESKETAAVGKSTSSDFEGSTTDIAEATADGPTTGKSATEPAGAVVAESLGDNDGLVAVPGATYAELSVESIVPNQRQPRTIFDEDELDELAASIKEVGVLQPVIVRPLSEPIPEHPEARYELIMGERRLRASQRAGSESIPAIVRRTADEDLLRDALLENLHRAQLNPLEEAAAYQQLLEDFECTQEELARRIARSRPQITNTLRLLKLPPLVQRRVAAGVLSAGHARALLGLADAAAMERVAQRIVAESLSVRQVEELVAMGDEPQTLPARRRRTKRYAPELGSLSGRLTDCFDTRVKVDMGVRKGTIKIDFATIEDLNRILGMMSPEVGAVEIEDKDIES